MSELEPIPELSEASRYFLSTQNDVEQLQKRFSSVLGGIKEAEPEVENILSDDYEEDTVETSNKSRTSGGQEVKLLIRELQAIQNDVRDLKKLLLSRKTTNRYKTAKINRQLDDIMQILDGQLFRAERLI